MESGVRPGRLSARTPAAAPCPTRRGIAADTIAGPVVASDDGPGIDVDVAGRAPRTRHERTGPSGVPQMPYVAVRHAKTPDFSGVFMAVTVGFEPIDRV